MTTRGEAAERLVVDRLRAVLPPDVELLHSVHWLARDHGAAAKGEADVVIGDPERGILVLEVKAGEIRRDDHGTWWAGPHELPRPPFQQAADNRYALVRKLEELPDWPAGLKPIAGEAVALPDVVESELHSLPVAPRTPGAADDRRGAIDVQAHAHPGVVIGRPCWNSSE